MGITLIDEILKQYSTQKEGLSSVEANARLKKYGLNKLEEKKKDSPLKLFFSQFFSRIFPQITHIISANRKHHILHNNLICKE